MPRQRQLHEFSGEGIADVVGEQGAADAAAENEAVGGANEVACMCRDIHVNFFFAYWKHDAVRGHQHIHRCCPNCRASHHIQLCCLK